MGVLVRVSVAGGGYIIKSCKMARISMAVIFSVILACASLMESEGYYMRELESRDRLYDPYVDLDEFFADVNEINKIKSEIKESFAGVYTKVAFKAKSNKLFVHERSLKYCEGKSFENCVGDIYGEYMENCRIRNKEQFEYCRTYASRELCKKFFVKGNPWVREVGRKITACGNDLSQ